MTTASTMTLWNEYCDLRDAGVDAEKLRVAVHEAGHAVAHIALGADFDRVELVEDEGRWHGRVKRSPLYVHFSAQPLPDMITSFAGGAALDVCLEMTGDDLGMHLDEKQIADVVRKLGWHERVAADRVEAAMDVLWDEACTLVVDHQHAIAAVARALMVEGELWTGKVSDLVLDAASPTAILQQPVIMPDEVRDAIGRASERLTGLDACPELVSWLQLETPTRHKVWLVATAARCLKALYAGSPAANEAAVVVDALEAFAPEACHAYSHPNHPDHVAPGPYEALTGAHP